MLMAQASLFGDPWDTPMSSSGRLAVNMMNMFSSSNDKLRVRYT